MKCLLKYPWICLFLLFQPLIAFVDFEDATQEFVLETKKINIPGKPFAFNPSIIRFQGRLLMSFRELIDVPLQFKEHSSVANSTISLVWLDEQFNPVSQPQTLELWSSELNHSRCDDARLLMVDGELHLIYSDNHYPEITDGGFRLHVVKLELDRDEFKIISNERLVDYDDALDYRREKNWVPFEYFGTLFLAYTIMPHTIYCPLLLGNGRCDTVVKTSPSIVWEWGEIRGGTPALPLDDDHYLSFFHSLIEMPSAHSEGKKVLHYFIGAYTFTRSFPFKITQVSPEPIVGKNFYHGPIYDYYWKPVRVVFPCGFIIENDNIWMSYGRQDHEIWVAKIDKKALLESLIQVTTIPNKYN